MNNKNSSVTLFSPGPTPISEETLRVFADPPLHHRSDEFKAVLKRTYSLLEVLFGVKTHKAVFTSTGSGALEASVVSFFNRNSKVLYVDGGKFGERWGEILNAYGLKNQSVKVKWGNAPDAKSIERKLIEEGPFDALCVQSCETSTGTAYDLHSLGKTLKKINSEALFVVDGITAVGAYPVPMEKFEIDVLISGSQKALGLPVGLSFLAFSENAYKKALTSDLPKFYFDALKESKNLKEGVSTFSTPTQLWLGLEKELLKISDKSKLEQKFKLCALAQTKITDFIHKRKDICLFSTSPSPSLTAIRVDDKYSAKVIQKKLLNEGFFVATGQGDYTDKLIRIGHMTNVDLKVLDDLLEKFDSILNNYDQESNE